MGDLTGKVAIITGAGSGIGLATAKQLHAAGMAIVGRLTPVAFGILFALSGAVGPIVGQNFGAKKFDRVLQAFWCGLLFVAGYVAVASLILYLLRDIIIVLFLSLFVLICISIFLFLP